MFSFNNRCMRPYGGNIRNGFTLMVRLRCAMLTNRASQNCSVFPSRAISALLHNPSVTRTERATTPIRRKIKAKEGSQFFEEAFANGTNRES